MKRSMRVPGVAWMAVAALAAAGLMSGCEEVTGDSRSDLAGVEGAFTLTPASYTYSAESTNVMAFTVRGGKPPFTWSLSDPASGTISAPDGEPTNARTVNYRPTTPAPGEVNVLRVRDAQGWSTTATISRRH